MYYESDFKNDKCNHGNCAENGYCEECTCSDCGRFLLKWEEGKCYNCIEKEEE